MKRDTVLGLKSLLLLHVSHLQAQVERQFNHDHCLQVCHIHFKECWEQQSKQIIGLVVFVKKHVGYEVYYDQTHCHQVEKIHCDYLVSLLLDQEHYNVMDSQDQHTRVQKYHDVVLGY